MRSGERACASGLVDSYSRVTAPSLGMNVAILTATVRSSLFRNGSARRILGSGGAGMSSPLAISYSLTYADDGSVEKSTPYALIMYGPLGYFFVGHSRPSKISEMLYWLSSSLARSGSFGNFTTSST